MDHELRFRKSAFERSMMTGVFIGIIVTIAVSLYHIIFVSSTGYPFGEIVNASNIIFAVNLFFLVIGILYYFFQRFKKAGEITFIVLFTAATILFLLRLKSISRSDIPVINHEFRELLGGIIILVALGTVLMLPLAFHSKKFEENVL